MVNEIILVLKIIGTIILSLGALAILLPLSFYADKKRKESYLYRHIEVSIFFVAFFWWAHSWDNSEIYLTWFWATTIIGFIITHILIHSMPLEVGGKKSK